MSLEKINIVDDDDTAEANPPSAVRVFPAHDPIEVVISTLKDQLGKPYQLGAEGPNKFDCSGLIWYAFNINGIDALIGDGRHRARWYAKWFQNEGNWVTNISEASRGSLVFYGEPNAIVHIAMYLGNRRRMAISAIHPKVSKHHVNGLVNMQGKILPIAGYGNPAYPAG